MNAVATDVMGDSVKSLAQGTASLALLGSRDRLKGGWVLNSTRVKMQHQLPCNQTGPGGGGVPKLLQPLGTPELPGGADLTQVPHLLVTTRFH